jgi:hypothetical protein
MVKSPTLPAVRTGAEGVRGRGSQQDEVPRHGRGSGRGSQVSPQPPGGYPVQASCLRHGSGPVPPAAQRFSVWSFHIGLEVGRSVILWDVIRTRPPALGIGHVLVEDRTFSSPSERPRGTIDFEHRHKADHPRLCESHDALL